MLPVDIFFSFSEDNLNLIDDFDTRTIAVSKIILSWK